MDLQTENRLAALLMEEARRLRQQAEKGGVHVYLQRNVRCRPNSRFLTATVLGVEQANRAVEVSEMWHAREKEVELDEKLKGRAKDKIECRRDKNYDFPRPSSYTKHGTLKRRYNASQSFGKHDDDEGYGLNEDDGISDDEVEEFLRSRAKRGRGAIGSRMDEPGPYLPSSGNAVDERESETDGIREEWEKRIIGSEKPSFLKTREWKRDACVISGNKGDMCVAVKDAFDPSSSEKDASTSKKHSPKDRSRKEKNRKKRREKRSKHHHHKRHKKD